MQHHPGSWYLPWGVPLQKMVAVPIHPSPLQLQHPAVHVQPMLTTLPTPLTTLRTFVSQPTVRQPQRKVSGSEKDKGKLTGTEKRKADDLDANKDLKKAKLETKALKAKRPGFTDDRYNETSYYIENDASASNVINLEEIQWLRNNIEPLPEVLDKWQNTCNIRLSDTDCTIAEYYNKYKSLQLPTGHLLLEIDFQYKYTNSSNRLLTEWPAIATKLVRFSQSIKDAVVQAYLAVDENQKLITEGLRKVYPYYFTFTTFTKGRWVGERILDVFAREFRAHPAEEYERCIRAGTLTVNYEKVPTDYKLKHNDLLANIVHRHEVPVTCHPITIVHLDDDVVVVNKPASIPVHPCGRYRHNTVVFILAKEYNLKNLRTIHRLDRLTSGLLLFGRSPKKARQMEHQIRNRLVQKEYICRVEGEFPEGVIECKEPIEVVSYKIGVCKVSPKGKDCITVFQKLGYNGSTSIVLCKPKTGRMHQIRVHLQYLGYPVVNDPLYNHDVFGPMKGKGGDLGGKTDEDLVKDLIHIHNAENWLGMDGDNELSMFNTRKGDLDDSLAEVLEPKDRIIVDDESDSLSREPSPCDENCENITSVPCDPVSHPLINCESEKVTVATQTGHEAPDLSFNPDKMTLDKHCYECKVRYRDPKPQDLVMYLHAWKYKGPGWDYETELPEWAKADWNDTDSLG